jgi:hypothetical protein
MIPKAADCDEAGAGEMFHFVVAQDSGADTKRRARSHAVKRALQQKRKLQLDALDNFRIVSHKTLVRPQKDRHNRSIPRQIPRTSPSPGMLDPFEVLAVDSRLFQKLLYDRKDRNNERKGSMINCRLMV